MISEAIKQFVRDSKKSMEGKMDGKTIASYKINISMNPINSKITIITTKTRENKQHDNGWA
jgi:hypothetical protein